MTQNIGQPVSQAIFLRLEIREFLTWSETYQTSENNHPFHGHSALRGTEGEDI